MCSNNQILSKTKFLKNYNIENIDENVVQKILSISKMEHVKSEKFISNIITFLNCYYSLQNKKLTYIGLSSKETKNNFSKFLTFLNPTYIELNKDSLSRCRKGFQKIIDELSKEHNSLKDIKPESLDIASFDKYKINYYNKYHIKDPRNDKSYFFNIVDLTPLFSFKEMEKMLSQADIFTSLHGGSLLKSSLPILKTFNLFLNDNLTDKYKLLEEAYSIEIIKLFCREYFKDGQKKNYCLNSRMRYWNDFRNLFDFIFIQTGLINLPMSEYPIAPKKDKKSFLTNIKHNNGIQYKKKLITEIPLNLNDNEAIDLLFSKIVADIEFAQRWYSFYLDEFEKHYKKPLFNLDKGDFNISSREFKKRNKSDLEINDILFQSGIPTHSTLEYFMFALVGNHPEITDSFLINFKLYDLNENLIGIKKTDAGTYLSGNKLRRGSKLAEQNILLNEKTEHIVNLLINSTKPIREELKENGNNDWCKLFVGLNENLKTKAKNKTIVPSPSNMRLSELKNRLDYFSKIDYIEDPLNYVFNLTLTKLRASKGVETYLNTESASEMSKVLGHEKYKPELLARYLPEVILNFFQTRWIRIFQKGIICEALKDSDYLYRASSFSSMEELDDFIKKNSISYKKEEQFESNKEDCEVFISINKDILSSLFSIEKAVSDSLEKINPKAIYWAEFSKRLRNEIKNENKNISFLPILKEAESNINPDLFKDVINV